MTHPAAGVPHPRPPDDTPDAVTAGLTPEQTAAVRHGRGPLLLVAGPGTGKTRTLTHRVAYLLASGRAAPRQILAVTFSVCAAGELRLRLAELLGEQTARGVTAATFHSVCARMLREHAGVFGRTENYTIYDPADLRHVIESLLSNGEHVEEVEVALDHPFEAGRERVLELALDGGPAGLGDQLGEGELERVEADLEGGLFVEVGLPVDAARLLLEFELLEPSLVTTSRTTGQLRGILARIAQAASQICALHERFGPEAPWGFADPSGWKCSARYCSHHARCPGGAGL